MNGRCPQAQRGVHVADRERRRVLHLGTSTGINSFTTRGASYMLMLMDMSSCIHTPLASLVLPTFLSLLVELQLEHRAVVQRLDGSAIVVHPLHFAQRLAEALDLGLHRHRRGG